MLTLQYPRTLLLFHNLVKVVERGKIRMVAYSCGAKPINNLLSSGGRSSNSLKYHQKLQEKPSETIRLNEIDKMFRFTDYDCIGFDLDNTICRYKVSEMIKLEYLCLAKFLISERDYSDKYLLKPVEENGDFLIKGLILDVKKGNLLRIAPDGKILGGCHGTKKLSNAELVNYYGIDNRWELTDRFCKDPLHMWNGPLSEYIRPLLDYFDMPAGLVFARAVDTLDEENGGVLNEYNIYPHIIEALQDMFHKDQFSNDRGGYFPIMKNEPEKYINKCSEKVMNWLHALKREKKILFLITGSNVDFASHTASYCMGPDWTDLFSIVICFAKKPGFFKENRPFIGLDGFKETNQISEENILPGIYANGNWKGLYNFLKKTSKNEKPNIIYIGDNIIQDIYAPNVFTPCDTIAICEELEAEGAMGHDKKHVDSNILASNFWGSYFHHDDQNDTIWRGFIQKHAKLCIPSLEYAAQFDVHHEF